MKNHLYAINIPQAVLDILAYAAKDDEVYTELELASYFSSTLGLELDRGVTIPFCDENELEYMEGTSILDGDVDYYIPENTPFEFFPIGSQGGDALKYGYLILAPELNTTDFPVASFSPADDFGLAWLGNNTTEAFGSLLTARLKRLNRHDPEALDDLLNNSVYRFLCTHFNLKPDKNDRDITRGARTDIRIQHESIPEGWLFKPDDRGVGVLAREETFNSAIGDITMEDPDT